MLWKETKMIRYEQQPKSKKYVSKQANKELKVKITKRTKCKILVFCNIRILFNSTLSLNPKAPVVLFKKITD